MDAALRVSVLVVLVRDVLRDADTPAGAPDTDSATLPLSPTGLTTPMVLVTAAPPTNRVALPAEEERLKLGVGMVTTILVVLVAVADVPVTVTV